MARDVYTRRMEGGQHLGRAVGCDHGVGARATRTIDFEPTADKIYRHPTFYELPDEVKHM